MAPSLLLQAVVSDRVGGTQRRLQVAGLEELFALLGVIGPEPRQEIGLQFKTNR
jgi:hypothetical protein